VEETSGSRRDNEQGLPVSNKEGVAAITEDTVHMIRRSMPASAASPAAHERTWGWGSGPPQRGRGGKKARSQVEKGTPTGSLRLRGSHKSLRDSRYTVLEHDTLRGSEGTSRAVGHEATLKGNRATLIHLQWTPCRVCHLHGVGEGGERLRGVKGRQRRQMIIGINIITMLIRWIVVIVTTSPSRSPAIATVIIVIIIIVTRTTIWRPPRWWWKRWRWYWWGW
jgi:hypothetical protein